MVNNKYMLIKEIKKYAITNKIPIMQDEGMDFLTTFIIKHQIKNVLEIGSAIGYSAIMMSLCNPNLKVTTIEKDEVRYLEAVKNIKKLDLEDRITLIFNDALKTKIEGKYDLIFMDDMMPKMSGTETFHKLKEDPNFNTPVVVLTANAIAGMEEKYLSEGFNGYLAKPIERKALDSIINKYLNNE